MKKLLRLLALGLLLTQTAWGAGIDANTALMLDGEGSGASIADTSLTPKTVTVVGGATQSTTQFKFGAKSIAFDGTGDDLTLADHADWDIAGSSSQDYTIDFFVRFTTSTGLYGLIEQWQDNSNRWVFWNNAGQIEFYFQAAASTVIDMTDAGSITTGTWYHLALVKKTVAGPTVTWGLYRDGVQVGYASYATTQNITGTMYIGTDNSVAGRDLPGFIDNLRVQKSNYFNASPNVGLTDTITVPTSAYSVNSASTDAGLETMGCC